MSSFQQPEVVMTFTLGKPTEIRVNGVKGTACRAFSKPFEEAIGGKITSDTPTAEMLQTAAVGIAQQAKTF